MKFCPKCASVLCSTSNGACPCPSNSTFSLSLVQIGFALNPHDDGEGAGVSCGIAVGSAREGEGGEEVGNLRDSLLLLSALAVWNEVMVESRVRTG